MGQGFLFGVIKMFLRYSMVIVVQLSTYTKYTEVYTLKWWHLWYVNYITIKK